jgi:hypothetical protein
MIPWDGTTDDAKPAKEDVADYEIRMVDGELVKVLQGVYLFGDRLMLVKAQPAANNAVLFSAPWAEVKRIRRLHDKSTKVLKEAA